jgi:glycosyltransferase involved in cell wall biosynthesis
VLTDAALASRLGESGRREVDGRFSWDSVVERVESVYDRVLTATSSKPSRR